MAASRKLAGSPAPLVRTIPVEIVTMLAFALAIFGVVATGSTIVAALTDPSPWAFAAAYGGPAALASGIYWLIAQRLNAR